MAIPDFQSIMLPLLKLAGDGEVHNFHNAVDKLANEFGLSEEEISSLIPSGQPRFENRVGWAKTYLKMSGLITYPKRSHLQITQKGIKVLEENPKKIDIEYLKRFPEFVEFRKGNQTEEEPPEGSGEELTPEEALENAYQKIRDDLADELLETVLISPPGFFEKLVVDLLVAMGYGGTQRDTARAVGKSGDEGIDGIIDEDRLGLDTIYVQAKRWQRDSKIGSPLIRDFVGALTGKNARKGVFITTADFTDDARNFASGLAIKVVLINGERLANLMIDYGIGVITRINYQIKNLDSDYFGQEH
ncbi:restriction endonuclease [Candidatus Dojkabacteria bacterium]|nr:restriction endonuclease [Candidatus Dojkabacteria bacterium]